MKLEAVITCVDYSDFLAETLPINRTLFDRLVVVTTPQDEKTQKLCEFWHVQCVTTDVFRRGQGEFCKGCGINAGLGALDRDGWVLHMDADIALPPQSRRILNGLELDPHSLYGVDRFDLTGWKTWAKHCRRPKLQHECGVYVHLTSHPLATRFMSPAHGGYVPIGFFQLWNPRASAVRTYPENHSSAGRSDMLFAARWPRARRAMLPELVAYHLQSERAPQGANWEGRKTRPFTGRRPPVAWWWWFWWWVQWWRRHPDPYFALGGAAIAASPAARAARRTPRGQG